MTEETAETAAYLPFAEQWYGDFADQGGRVGRGVDYIVGQAVTKAQHYREMGTAYDDFQPGNGTSYKLVLHDMNAPYVRLMVERDRENPAEPSDESWLVQLARYIHREHLSEAELWEFASRHTMTAYAGGELLVALPETAGGRCAVLSVHEGALFVPDYIGQRLGLRWGDALPLAVYLTAFVNAVATLRAKAVASV